MKIAALLLPEIFFEKNHFNVHCTRTLLGKLGYEIGLALTDLEVAQHQIMKIPDRSCPTDSSDMYLICI